MDMNCQPSNQLINRSIRQAHNIKAPSFTTCITKNMIIMILILLAHLPLKQNMTYLWVNLWRISFKISEHWCSSQVWFFTISLGLSCSDPLPGIVILTNPGVIFSWWDINFTNKYLIASFKTKDSPAGRFAPSKQNKLNFP